MGTKWGKPAHLLTNSHKNLQIWADMIFNMENLMVASIFNILEYFTHFGAPQGSKWAQKVVNLPISSQIVIRTYKSGQIWYLTWEIWWWHPFYHTGIFYPFWGTPGVKRGTKWGKPAHLFTNSHKNLTIWSDMIFNMRNLMAASIFTILEYFTHFGAPQGSKVAQNGVNMPISSQCPSPKNLVRHHIEHEKLDSVIDFQQIRIFEPF